MTTVNYELYKLGYPVDDGKIIFYDATDYILKTWKFKDAPIVHYKVKFDPNGVGMQVEMILSPAIQDYGCKIHRSWHITPIEEETYQSPIYVEEKKEEKKKKLRKYQIDQTGNITLCEGKFEDVGDYDVLINQKGEEIKVSDTSILPELEKIKEVSKSSYHGLKRLSTAIRGEGSQDDLFKIFNFAANNTNVEWSLTRANINMFGIGTYHNQSLSPGYVGLFKAKDVVAEIHSHPNIPTSLKEEKGSLLGDSWRRNSLTKKDVDFLYYTYFPNSGRIFSNGKNGAGYIRDTKGDYKRFFFGTLNTK